MLHVHEFEIFQDEGLFLAFPYDMPGGTQGSTFTEACAMAIDLLQAECEHRAMHGLPFPEPTFGNEPRNGGKTVIIAANSTDAELCANFGATIEEVEADAELYERGDFSKMRFGKPIEGRPQERQR